MIAIRIPVDPLRHCKECPVGRAYSSDLGKCMECSVCKNSEKSDFCQNCPPQTTEQPDFPWIWVIGFSAGGVFLITVILSLTVYLTHCRRKSKFTKPIEETGSHSAEALLIHGEVTVTGSSCLS
uniref:Uncharacterized protein n=1 Tax=Xenopus tropicalis TaxID=8364 RepID=A0A1B8XW13_XENTR